MGSRSSNRGLNRKVTSIQQRSCNWDSGKALDFRPIEDIIWKNIEP